MQPHKAIGGVLLGAALIFGTPGPAWAWGPLTHGAAAQRAFAILVTRQPWLAPHREAFLWGALAADVQDAPGASHLSAARTHGASTLEALWREAQPAGAGARAFVLGWAAHVAADEAQAEWLAAGDRTAAVRAAIAEAGMAPPPAAEAAETAALLDLAVDAAALPATGGLLRELALAAWHHAGTPAGAPPMGVVARVLGVDEPTYLAMAGLTAAMGARGADRYLLERARFGRVERWLEPVRSAPVRKAIGDLPPVITRLAEAGVARADQLAGPKAAPAKR